MWYSSHLTPCDALYLIVLITVVLVFGELV